MNAKILSYFTNWNLKKTIYLFLGILLSFYLFHLAGYINKCKIIIENKSGKNLSKVHLIVGQDKDTFYQISNIKTGSSKTIYVHFVGESTVAIDYEGNPKNSPTDLNVYIESMFPYRARITFLPNDRIKSDVSIN